MDRLLASSYGAYATELISKGDYGKMVAVVKDEITSIPLEEVGGKLRLVPTKHPMLERAYGLDICLGGKF